MFGIGYNIVYIILVLKKGEKRERERKSVYLLPK